MYTCPIELSDVRYNASTACFEASVTVHDNSTVRQYACAIAAPISTSFEEAAKGLARQAIRRHQHRGGLFSEVTSFRPKARAGRRGFDPVRWLGELVKRPGEHAA